MDEIYTKIKLIRRICMSLAKITILEHGIPYCWCCYWTPTTHKSSLLGGFPNCFFVLWQPVGKFDFLSLHYPLWKASHLVWLLRNLNDFHNILPILSALLTIKMHLFSSLGWKVIPGKTLDMIFGRDLLKRGARDLLLQLATMFYWLSLDCLTFSTFYSYLFEIIKYVYSTFCLE